MSKAMDEEQRFKKSYRTLFWVMFLLLICYASALIYTTVKFDNYVREHKGRISISEQYDSFCKITDKDEIKLLNGVYNYYPKFYCVYTHKRTPEEIKTTEYHEACHYFVDMDKDHFCNNEKQTKHADPEHFKDFKWVWGERYNDSNS